jgi:hypothetical protein
MAEGANLVVMQEASLVDGDACSVLPVQGLLD